MKSEEKEDGMLIARAHGLLAEDDLSPEELALLPRRFSEIRSARPTYRRMVFRQRMRLAAAFAGILGATVLLGPPVSAAMMRWLTRSETVAPTQATQRGAPASATTAVATSEYAFTPSGDVVVARFASWQERGTIALLPAPNERVVLQVQRQGVTVPVMVVPEGVRIANAGTSASYRLLLPPSVRRVDIEINGDIVQRVSTSSLGSRPTVPLRRQQ